MQPNEQTPQPNPYDYLLNPATQQKKPSLIGGGKPNKFVMVGFVVGVLILVYILFSVFTSLTAKNYNSVIELVERQNEITRIADLGLKDAHDPATRNYVSTIRYSTASEKVATLAFLKKKSVKVSDKQLVLKRDASIDSALKTALQDNTYDKVLVGKLNELVVSYQKAEKNVTGTSDTKSEKTLFATLLGNAKVIAGN